MDNVIEKKKPLKLLVVGSMGVGKTSLIKRYTSNSFRDDYKSTIGVDFALKKLNLDSGTLQLQIWDIAGQETFGAATRAFYRNAVGYVVVFDCTEPSSLFSALRWKKDIEKQLQLYYDTDDSVPCILLGNKYDLVSENEEWNTLRSEAHNTVEGDFAGFFTVSAKENTGIDESMLFLVKDVLEQNKGRGKRHKPLNTLKLQSDEVDTQCDC